MPRKLRIEVCGYHHVLNRGVAKDKVFLSDLDKEKFIQILSSVAKEYKFNIHSFCLMDNHYHLLVENKKENLSDGMRQINSQYAMYFNKKYKRVGHLWQGRYNSWYVFDEAYLFTLFKYIEQNPIKAKITKKIGEYKYCASYSILHDGVPFFLQNSFVLRFYAPSELLRALEVPINSKELEKIDTLHKQKYIKKDDEVLHVKQKELSSYFENIETKIQRNEAILKAYEDEYNKSEIARQINLSVTAVSKILKKFKV